MSRLSGRTPLTWLLIALLCASASVEARNRNSKRARTSSKPTKKEPSRSSGIVYGDRKPWEGRQETYDWEFKEVRALDHTEPLSPSP